MDSSNKAISALCYFSIFFAGFILPLIVYFVSNDDEVKKHAKSAFISHIIPFVFIPLAIIAIFFDLGMITGGGIPLFLIGIGIIGGIVSFIIFIWNIYKGIKVLL
ncbi:membrane protein [Heyndrickxia sporothermodurans]|nr:membrane protein [Heyndrickxia sporothermodurans]